MSVQSQKRPRVLFSPHEIGGQMQMLAETLRRRGYTATAAAYNREWFGYVNDIDLDLAQYKTSREKQARAVSFFKWARHEYDVFHFFWGRSMLGSRFHPHPDLPILKRMGKTVVCHFRGLDVVDLKYFDYLRDRTDGKASEPPPMSRPDQLRSLKYWTKYADALLVSEPDLHAVVPNSILVPQAIDLAVYRPAPLPGSKDGRIRIAHAPSMRRKKGTEYVECAVAQLRSEGLNVELILIENVPFQEVKALYASADIGIDQMLYGWHGKVSLELMAMGRPVICYLDEELVTKYRPDIPIVNANPCTLVDQIKALCINCDRRRELSEAGIDYVRRYHDAERVIDQCLQIYSGSGASERSVPAGWRAG